MQTNYLKLLNDIESPKFASRYQIAIFDFRSACWLKGFTKTFNGDFQLCLPLEKVRVNSCIDVDVYIYIYVIYI